MLSISKHVEHYKLLYHVMLYRIELVGDCRHGFIRKRQNHHRGQWNKRTNASLSWGQKDWTLSTPSQALNPEEMKQSLISVYLLPRKIFPTRPDKSSIKTFKPTIAHPICLMKSYFSVPTCPNQKKWLFQINFPRLTCFHAWCPWPTGLLRTTWTTLGRAPLGDLALGLGLRKSWSWGRDNEGSTSARPGLEKTWI